MNELALFAGAGGGILGGMSCGFRTVCAVEIEPYCIGVLLQRQNDGILPPFPIWDDVCTFDGKPWRGIVDVVSGGFPCQDISAAGKGAGITGDKSGLWVEMARIVGEVRPRYVFVENSPRLVARGLGVVLGDLAALGFDARWGVLGAADVGAPHLRERIWIVAYADSKRRAGSGVLSDIDREEGKRRNKAKWSEDWECSEIRQANGTIYREWIPPPEPNGSDDGLGYQLDRLKAIGNGQVPQCAAEAWRILSQDAAPAQSSSRTA